MKILNPKCIPLALSFGPRTMHKSAHDNDYDDENEAKYPMKIIGKRENG